MLIPTAQLREADFEKSAYLGFAKAQMRILADYMRVSDLNVYSRVVTLANGTVITCRKCFDREDIFIDLPTTVTDYTEIIASVSGIILHPRSGSIEQLAYTEYVNSPYGSSPETRHAPGVKGGWAKGKTELATKFIYPLVDADEASFFTGMKREETVHNSISERVDTETVSAFLTPGMYGNLYWCNDAVWDADTETYDKPFQVLSWHGTPTRHFRLPSNIEIPGLSIFETSVPGAWEDKPEYTAFGTKLYGGGSVIADAPHYSWPYNGSGVDGRCLILGAMQTPEGKTFIVTQNDHKNAPKYVWVFSDGHVLAADTDVKASDYLGIVNGATPKPNPEIEILSKTELTKPGFFLGLWLRGAGEPAAITMDGWTLISEFAYSRNGLPWFGNVSGTEFLCSNGDKLTTEGVLTLHVAPMGTSREVATLTGVVGPGNPNWPAGTEFHDTSRMSFSKDYTANAFYEYRGDVSIASPVSVSFRVSSGVQATASVERTYEGSFPLLIVDPGTPVIFGPEEWLNTPNYGPANYTVYGGEAPYTWSWPSGSCGMGTITVYDCHGREGTRQVRLPVGYWLETGHTCSQSGCYVSGMQLYSVVTLDTKIDTYFYPQCWCEPAENDYEWCRTGKPSSGLTIPGWGACQASAAPYGGMWYPYNGSWFLNWVATYNYTWHCP